MNWGDWFVCNFGKNVLLVLLGFVFGLFAGMNVIGRLHRETIARLEAERDSLLATKSPKGVSVLVPNGAGYYVEGEIIETNGQGQVKIWIPPFKDLTWWEDSSKLRPIFPDTLIHKPLKRR